MCWSLKPWINTLLCVCVCIEPLMLPALLKSFASFLGQCRCYYYYSWSHFFRGDRWCKKGIHTGVLCCQAVELAWTTACCLAPEPHWFTTTSSVSPVPFLGFFSLLNLILTFSPTVLLDHHLSFFGFSYLCQFVLWSMIVNIIYQFSSMSLLVFFNNGNKHTFRYGYLTY